MRTESITHDSRPGARRRTTSLRIAGLALAATLLGSVGSAAVNAAPASAGPITTFKSFTIRVKTGNDDKRRDSSVSLVVLRGKLKSTIVFSPASKHGGPGPNADDTLPFKMDTGVSTFTHAVGIKQSQITGFDLKWVQGHNGWTNGDEWDFDGIQVVGTPSNGNPDVLLVDTFGKNMHLVGNALIPLASFPAWSGSYDGVLNIGGGVLVHADVDTVNGDTSATVVLLSNAPISVCGLDLMLPANQPLDLDGVRTQVDVPNPGDMSYELTKQFHPGYGVDPILTIDVTVSADQSTVDGTVTLTNLPSYCGFTPIPIHLHSDPAGPGH